MRVLTIIASLSCCVAGCVSDSFPEGLPCDGAAKNCPPGQTCFSVGADSLCYASQPDDPDAAPDPIDAPVAIDAGFDAARDAMPDAMPDATVGFDAFTGPCDPIGQNCPQDMACYWEPTGAICDTEGSGIFRQPCVANADCRSGLGCFPAPGMTMQCAPYCDINNGTPCTGLDVCMVLAAPVGACVFGGCDPIAQNCTPTEGCYIDPQQTNQTMCLTDGAAVHGEPCTNNDDCSSGHHCLSCGAFSECASYCDTGNSDADCLVHADGSTCQAIEGTVGACGPCS